MAEGTVSAATTMPGGNSAPQIIGTTGGSAAGVANNASKQAAGAARGSRPKKVGGTYPERNVIYYHFSVSDIRSIGVAQVGATVMAAIGTWCLSNYMDLAKDLALLGDKAPEYLLSISEMFFYAWVISWCVSLAAFIWQGTEIGRIKREHGETTLPYSIAAGFAAGIGRWWSKISCAK